MNAIVTRYAEAGFALLVTCAAMIWPPLALGVAGAYLVALAVLADRRSTPEPETEP